MPANATQQWLKTNVGEPSGKWGSKYSEIYKLTAELEKNKVRGRKDKPLIEKLYRLCNEFSRSAHGGAKTVAEQAEKDRQQRQLNAFRAALQLEYMDAGTAFKEDVLIKLDKADASYPTQRAMVDDVIARMAASSNQLLANTGRGLQGVKIVMVLADGTNGSWNSSSKVMSVNPVLAYNHSILQGLLVHEYHHMLNDANYKYGYLDEFVAHWKQFSVTRPPMSEHQMVAECNARLAQLYGGHVGRWTAKKSPAGGNMGCRLVRQFADVGDFLVRDNAAPRIGGAVNHGCATAA